MESIWFHNIWGYVGNKSVGNIKTQYDDISKFLLSSLSSEIATSGQVDMSISSVQMGAFLFEGDDVFVSGGLKGDM